MTSKQLTEWMAYFHIQPFGNIRADLRTATLTSLIANVNRDTKKKKTPFMPADFMPFLRRGKEKVVKQSGETIKKILLAIPGFKIKEKKDGTRR